MSAAAAAEADAAAVRQLNWQLLERMTQQEMAAAAVAMPVASYPISHAGTDIRCVEGAHAVVVAGGRRVVGPCGV
jgi:hypothetical protein